MANMQTIHPEDTVLLVGEHFSTRWPGYHMRGSEKEVENIFIRCKATIKVIHEGFAAFQSVSVYRRHGLELLCKNCDYREFATIREALAWFGYFSVRPTYPPLEEALAPDQQAPTEGSPECPEFEKFIAEALPEEELRTNFLGELGAALFGERCETQKPPLPGRRA